MFLAAGPTAHRFCEWVDRLGEASRVLGATEPGPIGEGVQLLHLEAARHHGALISIDLGAPDWIRAHRSSRTAYKLATIRTSSLPARPQLPSWRRPWKGLQQCPW